MESHVSNNQLNVCFPVKTKEQKNWKWLEITDKIESFYDLMQNNSEENLQLTYT